MKIIEDFDEAREVLSRETVSESITVTVALQQSLQKLFGTGDPEIAVRQIVEDVKKRGDATLFDLTLRIDGVKLSSLEVARDRITDACQEVDNEFIGALKLAAERIQAFHMAQKDSIWHEVSGAGLSQLIRPLRRIGVYVPGGTAAYPSTVLMTAIPARVAGVSEVIMVTPPTKDGNISPVTLAAADIARVDRIFSIGGAQAVAALAYGTKSVPAVDKICGPGNIFVTLAKKAVFGVVDIDGLQGPSEVFIIADENADAGYCAADLLAQAEHDPLASGILVTTSRRQAGEIDRELKQQLPGLSRCDVAGESLKRGLIAVVSSLDEAIELANLHSPEHLSLMIDNASEYINKITNAGCIVVGREATVVLGDYVAGPSHVLPTGGTARFSSPLNVSDFFKFINVVDTEVLDIKQIGKAASIIARAEGLDAHALAMEKRLKDIS